MSDQRAANNPTASKPQGFDKAAVALLGTIGGIQVSDPVIAAISLVEASTALSFSAAIQSLAAGISTLALAATVIPGGLLADRMGRKGILMLALVMSAVGQLTTAFAPNTAVFLTGRVIAGIALGVVFGAAYGLLREVAHGSVGPAMGLFNVMNLVIALTFGFAGGAIASANWRISFMLLPVLSMICLVLLRPLVPKVPKLPGGSIDYLGMFFVGLGVVGVLYGISNAALNPTKPSCWVPILIGLAAFVAFGITESKVKEPVFPIKLLAHPAFLAAAILGITWNMGNGAAVQMVANTWQYLMGFNTVQVSVDELFMTLAAVAGSVVAGRLLGKGSLPRTLGTFGLVLLGCGFFMFLFASPTAGIITFIPGMLAAGFGWMMDATTQGAMFLRLAPAKYFGPVTSSKVTVGQFGYSLGVSGASAVISMVTLARTNNQLAPDGKSTDAGSWQAITEYLQHASTTNPVISLLTRDDLVDSYLIAFKITALILGILVIIGAIAFNVLLRRKKAEIPVEEFLADETSPARAST